MIWTDEVSAGIWHVELRRPEKHNALGVEAYASLADTLGRICTSLDARAVVLSSQGQSFCAGNDLTEFATHWPQPPDGPVMRFLEALHATPVPIIAAVQGAAVGIGATMLLHCDIIIASSDAYLQFPFIDRGIVPEAASSLLLPLQVGYGRAMELLLTGRRVAADEALALGLVTRISQEHPPLGMAFALASTLAGKSAVAVAATKRLVRLSLLEAVKERFSQEIDAINRLLPAA